MKAFCATCDSEQEVESTGEGDSVYCLACGEEFVPTGAGKGPATGGKYQNYKIGKIMQVEPVGKSKDLKICQIDVNGDGKTIPVVTNAKYCEAGWTVIVACIGAVVPAGATVGEDDDEVIVVAKRNVQGADSQGMICDCQMLGWTGGAKGFIQQLPDTFKIGDPIPDARPRA